MPFSESERQEVEVKLDAFLERRRPPEQLRDRVDVAWRIDGESVKIFEIRALWTDPGETIEAPVAKATYVRTEDRWRVYWQPSDRKWHSYEPHPEVVSLSEFLDVVDVDANACFWG